MGKPVVREWVNAEVVHFKVELTHCLLRHLSQSELRNHFDHIGQAYSYWGGSTTKFIIM